MNNNFLGIRGLYKTHMDELKPFNSKSVTYTYIGYTEHNSRGQPIVWRGGGGGDQGHQRDERISMRTFLLHIISASHRQDKCTSRIEPESK